MKIPLIVIFIAILVVAGAVISSVPLKSVTYAESVPYTTTETYYLTETNTQEIPLNYTVVGTNINNSWWRMSSDCTVTIKNTDISSGYFRVEFNMATQTTILAPSKTVTKVAWLSIDPGKQKDITVRYEGDHIGNFTFSITPPTREVTTSQQVPKTSEVVNYQEVVKTKKVTLLEYWRS